METRKSIEVLDESTYIVGGRRGDSNQPSIKEDRGHRGDLGQPFLWRAAADKPATGKPATSKPVNSSGQWPLGSIPTKPDSKSK